MVTLIAYADLILVRNRTLTLHPSQESDLRHVFQLPTEYATVLDVDKLRSFSRFSPLGSAQGGVHFFRPCPAVRLTSGYQGHGRGRGSDRLLSVDYRVPLPCALTACFALYGVPSQRLAA